MKRQKHYAQYGSPALSYLTDGSTLEIRFNRLRSWRIVPGAGSHGDEPHADLAGFQRTAARSM